MNKNLGAVFKHNFIHLLANCNLIENFTFLPKQVSSELGKNCPNYLHNIFN